MKYRLVELLCCTECRSDLKLESLGEEQRQYDYPEALTFAPHRCATHCALEDRPVGDGLEADCKACYGRHINEGVLTCTGCGRRYPVIKGIPRCLPRGMEPVLSLKYRDFYDRHREKIGFEGIDDASIKGVRKTFDSFNTQWGGVGSKMFSKDMYSGGGDREEQRRMLHEYMKRRLDEEVPFDEEFRRGKVGGDLGCGTGHSTGFVAGDHCEMVGMDLTFGLEIGAELYRDKPNVHYVEASIFELPFRDGTFDFGYSVGVIHHTPDPAAAFAGAARTIGKGNPFSIFVYALQKMNWAYRLSHLTFLRPFTRNLPMRMKVWVCLFLAVIFKTVLWLFDLPFKIIPQLRPKPKTSSFRDFSQYTINAVATDFFDRLSPPYTFFHTDDEIRGWYEKAEYEKIETRFRSGGRGWIGVGFKA